MTTINRKEYELVDEILKDFDFEKCYLTMALLNWKWVT